MADPDVIVIGAGAAGIAAASAIAAAGHAVRLVEARPRLGGRAFTSTVAGYELDMGCGWLHSADENELAGLAAARGFTVDRTVPPWQRQGNAIGFPPGEQDDFRAAIGSFFERLDAAGEAAAAGTAPDVPGARSLAPGCRWNPLIDATSTYINGVELDGLSALDFWNYHDTGVNWRVTEGYGTFIASLAAGLDTALGCPATRVDHAGRDVRVATARGDLRARAVVVAVPTNVLANGDIAFSPALPDKIAAAAALPLGLADKVFLRLDGAEEFPVNTRFYGAVDRTATGNYHIRPFGRPVIEGYFGGRCARELETAGEGAFAAFAIDQFAAALGGAFRKRLHPLAASSWTRDPYALGSYSYAQPGHVDARPRLAAPVDGRLFFAGEACSVHDFSTTHGAWRTGVAAAAAVVAALGVAAR
jgi:monoamine oxidase